MKLDKAAANSTREAAETQLCRIMNRRSRGERVFLILIHMPKAPPSRPMSGPRIEPAKPAAAVILAPVVTLAPVVPTVAAAAEPAAKTGRAARTANVKALPGVVR